MKAFDVFILAGGLGSRSKNPLIPKILQEVCGSRRVIDFLREQLETTHYCEIRFLLGHLAEETSKQILENFPDASISVREPLGTSDAIFAALPRSLDRSVLVIPGDLLVKADLNGFMHDFSFSEFDAMFLLRSTDHPEDSDVVSLGIEASLPQIFLKGEKRPRNAFLWGLTGVLAMRPTSLKKLPSQGNVVEAITHLYRKGDISLGYKISSDYFLDTGTPERLRLAGENMTSGAVSRRGNIGKRAIFIDRDGTLINDLGTGRKTIADWEVPDEVFNQVRRANLFGIPIFIVTNQPGIAKGEITKADVEGIFAHLQKLAGSHGARFDDYRYCPHHPDRGFNGEISELKIACGCRKPGNKMLLDLALVHNVDLEKSIVIGDSWRDSAAAASVKSKFIEANPKTLVKVLSMAADELI